ncbi:YrvL family regulatory protein [Peptacetobacter sp.]|uniref:YrvL family regulatory protein n=1 Tax=Peptacetobacter sp. TaxID=2991975 RepID=UPI0026254244|nr:YrvL family regulatory protein [Peptacetobacter sp.]
MNKFKIDKEKFKTFIICSTIFLVVLSIIALISGSIMKIFGFQYKSIGSIILFFIIATIMSFPLNLIASAFPKALIRLGKINRQTAFIIYLILDTIATSFGLKVVDYYMPTVSTTNISIIIISLILAFMGKDNFRED